MLVSMSKQDPLYINRDLVTEADTEGLLRILQKRMHISSCTLWEYLNF